MEIYGLKVQLSNTINNPHVTFVPNFQQLVLKMCDHIEHLEKQVKYLDQQISNLQYEARKK